METISKSSRLYKETYDAHSIVDAHPFVSFIGKNDIANELYMNFNKICIYTLQNPLLYSKLDNNLLQQLHRTISIHDTYTILTSASDTLISFLDRCEKYPLEHAYMFYLGILFGGNILKNKLPKKYHDFLTYYNPKELVKSFKKCIDDNDIDDNDIDISIVIESYHHIKIIFDEFINKCKPDVSF